MSKKAEVPRLQVFYCTSEKKINGENFVYIEAERWYKAREIAYSIYGVEAFKMTNVSSDLCLHRKSPDHHGNWWLVWYSGNAANNSLTWIITRYDKTGRARPWAVS